MHISVLNYCNTFSSSCRAWSFLGISDLTPVPLELLMKCSFLATRKTMLIWNSDRQTYWQTQVWQWDISILGSEIPSTFLSWVYVHLPVDNDSLLIFPVSKKVSDTSWKNCWFEVVIAVWIICLHFLMILCSLIWNKLVLWLFALIFFLFT